MYEACCKIRFSKLKLLLLRLTILLSYSYTGFDFKESEYFCY